MGQESSWNKGNVSLKYVAIIKSNHVFKKQELIYFQKIISILYVIQNFCQLYNITGQVANVLSELEAK